VKCFILLLRLLSCRLSQEERGGKLIKPVNGLNLHLPTPLKCFFGGSDNSESSEGEIQFNDGEASNGFVTSSRADGRQKILAEVTQAREKLATVILTHRSCFQWKLFLPIRCSDSL
jgi:hypothetical protein